MNEKPDIDDLLERTWQYSVAPSEWEGQKGYYAWVTDMPARSAFASTQAEALSAVAHLLPTYLQAAAESNALLRKRAESVDVSSLKGIVQKPAKPVSTKQMRKVIRKRGSSKSSNL